MRMLNLLVENTSNRKKILKLCSHIPLVRCRESARSTPGPGEMWREALQLVLLVSVPMRLVHGRLALTFRASSCGGGGQALAWPDEPQRGGVSGAQALPRDAVQLASALRCLGLGVWWRRDSPSSHTTSTGGTPCVASTTSRGPTEVSRAMASACAWACAPGARRFETIGSTWLACRCFGDADGYTLRTLAAGWHSNAMDYAFHRWFLTGSIDRSW